MKDIFSILLLCLAATMTTAQNCDMKFRELLVQMDYQLDIIDSLTYASITPLSDSYEMQELKETSEKELVEKHPDIFVKEGECYKFHDGIEPQFACPLDTTKDMKEYSRYEFIGTYCNQALVYRQGYEWWDYLSVDLSDGNAIRFYGKPISYNCETVLAYGQIYSENGISIVDLQSKRQLMLGIETWEVSESKQTMDDFYLLLETNHIRCSVKKKYVKIKITNPNTR